LFFCSILCSEIWRYQIDPIPASKTTEVEEETA
jgi:hypothetical protein